MKGKICFYPLFLLIILIFCSCNNEIFDEPNIENKSPKIKSGEVFTVAPNGVDDTQNIKDAFADAKAAGSGNTVYLTEGTFHTSILVIENFDGYFMGAGKGNTTIISLTNLPCPEMMAQDVVPTLILFSAGFPKISDMTIEFVENPCQTYTNPFHGYPTQELIVGLGIGPHAIDESFDCTGGPVVEEGHSTIDNVELIDPGQIDVVNLISIGGYTSLSDPDCYGWFKTLKGTHTITNCDFYGGVVGVDIFIMIDSKIIIGGSPHNGNNFKSWQAIDAFDCDNTLIEVSYNEMDSEESAWMMGGFTFFVYDRPFIPLGSYYFHHNKIITENLGIYPFDLGVFISNKTLDVLIENNDFVINDGYAGIISDLLQDMIVKNNKFSGTSNMGIDVGNYGLTCSNWTIMGNNFNNLTTSWSPIWLGPDAENCTVVGGNNKVNVLDEGTNNIITGVNNQGNPPGPVIREALATRKDLLKLRRR